MMKIAILSLAMLALAGCADTPEGRAEFRENFLRGLAAGAATRPAYQPVYQAPAYQPPTTTRCRRWGNQVTCNTY